ncbi:MAG: 1,4-alpha-glucan branching enzyme, partial [Deltaproteobacteria bacterium]|nr:1,4-alpha-glucan branching enzyme [Deltaproteobacteria bacterium]
MLKPRYDVSLFSDYDIFLFKKGSHLRLYERLGAHPFRSEEGTSGCCFAVWAPNARAVSVIGDFNGWRAEAHPLAERWDGSGIWEVFIPGLGPGALYKYQIVSQEGEYRVQKSDPFAFFCETPPRTASVVRDLAYEWGDEGWLRERASRNGLAAPISIYELHPGSWRRVPEQGMRPLNYRELA